jgi:hypothetical protein
MSFEAFVESKLVWLALAFLLTGALIVFTARHNEPDAVAARQCASHYHAAHTSADSAAIDPRLTLTRGGIIAPHTCRELRLAGRTD